MKNNVLFIVVPTVDEGHSDDAESSCCYSDIDSMDEEEMCSDPDWLPPRFLFPLSKQNCK
jgi:hypothetical protein